MKSFQLLVQRLHFNSDLFGVTFTCSVTRILPGGGVELRSS